MFALLSTEVCPLIESLIASAAYRSCWHPAATRILLLLRLPRCAGCSRRSRKGSAARPRSKIAVNVRRLRRFIRSVVRGVPAVSLCSLSLFLSIIFLPFFSFYARRRLSRFIRSVARGASAAARVVESTHGVLKSSVLGAESSSVPSADEACPLLASSLES